MIHVYIYSVWANAGIETLPPNSVVMLGALVGIIRMWRKGQHSQGSALHTVRCKEHSAYILFSYVCLCSTHTYVPADWETHTNDPYHFSLAETNAAWDRGEIAFVAPYRNEYWIQSTN